MDEIGAITIKFFIVFGIASIGIALLGSFAVSVIAGIFGTKNFANIVFATSGFTAALACFGLSASLLMLVSVTIIKLRSKSLKLRMAISALFAYSFAFFLSISVGFCAIWWGFKMITGTTPVK